MQDSRKDFVVALTEDGLTTRPRINIRTDPRATFVHNFTSENSATAYAFRNCGTGKKVLLNLAGDRSQVIIVDELVSDEQIECPLMILPSTQMGNFLVNGTGRVAVLTNQKYRMWVEHTKSHIPTILVAYYKYVRDNSDVIRQTFTGRWAGAFACFRTTISSTIPFIPQWGVKAMNTTVFKCDKAYNDIFDDSLPEEIEVPYVPPGMIQPHEVNNNLQLEFNSRIQNYFKSPRRPETCERMSSNPIGEYRTGSLAEACVLSTIDKRSTFTPENWLNILKAKRVCYPFPKVGQLRSDGTVRTVMAMDVSYEAHLRQKFGLRNYSSEYDRSLFNITEDDLREYRYSYDIKHCDEQLIHYVMNANGCKDLIPYIINGGKFYVPDRFPSGSLFTAALTRIFLESVLSTLHIRPSDVKISGDGFICKHEVCLTPILPVVVMRGADSQLSGFDYLQEKPRYTRAYRLRECTYMRRGKIGGKELWCVRYKAYEKLRAPGLPPRRLFVRISHELGPVGPNKLMWHEMTDYQISCYLSGHKLCCGRTASRAFDVQRRPQQNVLENPLTRMMRVSMIEIPDVVYV